MKYYLKILSTLLAVVSYSFCTSQNVGINNNTPQATLDVYGDVIFRSADLVVADGTTLALDVNNNRFSYYRINGPTANFVISGITEAIEGRLVTLFNRSGFTMLLKNLDNAALVTNRIITGTNVDLSLDSKSAVNLQYDGLEQKWIVLSNSKTSSGGSSLWTTIGGSIFNSNAGNVGIGTNDPFYKLDVNGKGSFYGPPITFADNGFGNKFEGGALKFTTPAGPFVNTNMVLEGNKIQSYIFDAGLIDEYAGSLNLNPLGGNVGIGTDNPIANSKVTLQANDNYTTALTIQNPSASVKFQAFVGGPNNGNTISLGTPGAMPMALYTNSANRMFITANGNIGIGTDNPDAAYLLSVNGKIKAREIRVTTANWADYVFAKDYKLMPLKEVEAFINTNKHLPNISAASEIEKNGLDISAMQSKMMEKIEELTLYLIEANKKIENLERKLDKK